MCSGSHAVPLSQHKVRNNHDRKQSYFFKYSLSLSLLSSKTYSGFPLLLEFGPKSFFKHCRSDTSLPFQREFLPGTSVLHLHMLLPGYWAPPGSGATSCRTLAWNIPSGRQSPSSSLSSCLLVLCLSHRVCYEHEMSFLTSELHSP